LLRLVGADRENEQNSADDVSKAQAVVARLSELYRSATLEANAESAA
jgi:hypothetical protein